MLVLTLVFPFLTQNIRRHNHELLESKATTSVRTTVENVHEGDRENVRLLGTSKIGDVDVKRDTLWWKLVPRFLSTLFIPAIAYLLSSSSLCDGHRNTENSVGTELALGWSTIELVEELINLGLVLDINVLLEESRCNHIVDISNSLENTLAWC